MVRAWRRRHHLGGRVRSVLGDAGLVGKGRRPTAALGSIRTHRRVSPAPQVGAMKVRRPATGPGGMPVRSWPSEPRRVGVGRLARWLGHGPAIHPLRVMLAPARRPRMADEVLLNG